MSQKPTLRLQREYLGSPLVFEMADGLRPVTPQELNLTRDLQHALAEWAERYDATLDISNPRNSGWDSAEAATKFDEDGQRLFERLREELKDRYVVRYYHP